MGLKQWFQTESEKGQKPTKKSYVLLIGLVGILFILVSNIFSDSSKEDEQPMTEKQEVFLKNEAKKETNERNITQIQEETEDMLTEALNALAGVSDVQVVVQLNASDLKIYEKTKQLVIKKPMKMIRMVVRAQLMTKPSKIKQC